jgi:hypothetical protein
MQAQCKHPGELVFECTEKVTCMYTDKRTAVYRHIYCTSVSTEYGMQSDSAYQLSAEQIASRVAPVPHSSL